MPGGDNGRGMLLEMENWFGELEMALSGEDDQAYRTAEQEIWGKDILQVLQTQ